MDKIGICDRCSEKANCHCLCPEAELYAGQDYIGPRDMLIGKPIWGVPISELKSPVKLTKTQAEIIRLLLIGSPSSSIPKSLNISNKSYREIIFRIKAKL